MAMKEEVKDKVITLEPSRNLLCFNTFDEINYLIINKYVEIVITKLKSFISTDLLLDYKTTIEIRSNYENYSLRINTKLEPLSKIILHMFLEEEKCCYLEINEYIHKNGLFKDILSLEYHPKSFRQPDDSIRNFIIEWFQKKISKDWDAILFFGGECTMLGKILSGFSIFQYFYTDFASIYYDIQKNYKNPKVKLIDYKKWKCDLTLSSSKHCCIINTGYKGMKENLAKEICKIESLELYVISCNLDSWEKDWYIIKEFYNLLEKIEILTNYSIWIYKLSRKL